MAFTLPPLPYAHDALEPAIRGEIEAAVTFARESPLPDDSDLFRHVYAPRRT